MFTMAQKVGISIKIEKDFLMGKIKIKKKQLSPALVDYFVLSAQSSLLAHKMKESLLPIIFKTCNSTEFHAGNKSFIRGMGFT